MVDLEQCSLCAVISPVYHGGPWAAQSLCCHQPCISWWTLSSAVSVLSSALYIMVDLEQCSICAVISPVYHDGPWAVQSLCCDQPCISWWTLISAVYVLSSALYIMVDLEQCSLCAVISPVYHGGPWAVQSLCCDQPCISWWTLSIAVSMLSSALYIMVDIEQCSLCAVISPVYHGGPWAVQSRCCHQPCISWSTLSSAASVLSSALYIMEDLEQCSLCAVISPVYHGEPWAVQSLCCHEPCISWWTLSSAVSVLSSALYIMVDLEQCSLCAVISPVYHGGPWAVQSLCCHQPCISRWTLSSAVSVLSSALYIMVDLEQCSLCAVYQPCVSRCTLSSAVSVRRSALYIMADLEQCSLCAVISPVYHGGPWAVQSLCCHQPCISWSTLSSAVSVLSSALYIMVDLEQCSLCAVISPVYHGRPWAVQSLCCDQPCISWSTLSSAVSVLSSTLYIMVDLEQCSLCAVISPVYRGRPWAVQSLCCDQPCISWSTLSSAVSVLWSALYIMVDLEQCSLCAVISPVYHGGPWAVQSLCCHQPCISWSTLSSAVSVLWSALYIMVDLEQCSLCAVIRPVYQPCISWWTLSSAVSVLSSALYIMVDLEQCRLWVVISPEYHGGPWAVQSLCCYQPCISWWTLSSTVSVLSSALYIMVDFEQCSICAAISPVYNGGPWAVQSLCCDQPCI